MERTEQGVVEDAAEDGDGGEAGEAMIGVVVDL